MAEVRNITEGSLRWVEASGSGLTWATAASPNSGLIGFVTNLTYTSARDIQAIMDRGKLSHYKFVGDTVFQGSFDIQAGVTAQYPPVHTTGSGATVPMIHLEIRESAEEQGAAAAIWQQLHGVAILSQAWTHAAPADTFTMTFNALGAPGATGSGYLS